jgi:hypothetical protein
MHCFDRKTGGLGFALGVSALPADSVLDAKGGAWNSPFLSSSGLRMVSISGRPCWVLLVVGLKLLVGEGLSLFRGWA